MKTLLLTPKQSAVTIKCINSFLALQGLVSVNGQQTLIS